MHPWPRTGGDQQLAGKSNDHDRADASFGAAGARGKPPRQRALRLEAQPAPGELHDDAADAGIAVLADPLLTLDAAAAERRAGETGKTGDRATVAERPAEHLADQQGRGLQAEADDLGEMPDHPLGLVRVRYRCHPIALGLDLPELLREQTVPRHQPPQLGHRLARQRHAGKAAQLLEPFRRLLQAWPEVGDPMQTQQVLDAVLELDPLADQTLALSSWPSTKPR